MLRYKTQTRPSLVGLYDIWPGNGAGQFLQPRSPHGAHKIASISNQRLTILCRKNCQHRARFVIWHVCKFLIHYKTHIRVKAV